MRLLLAANNQATRRNEIIKSYLQLGSSSNRYAPRLPQQETKSSTKQLAPTDPILGPESLLKTGFAQKGLPSTVPRQRENVAGTIKHGQHLIVLSNDMLASKHALSRGRKSWKVAAELFRCSQSVFVSAKYLQCIAA